MRRRFLAAWVLMAVLSVAPSLALAATVCASHCCPVAAAAAAGDADEASSGVANRACCTEAPAPFASVAPAVTSLPSPPAILPRLDAPVASAPPRPPARGADAERVLRTSPLRLSVVLLI